MEKEIADELLFHLQKEIETNVKAGMTPEEARYAALRSFGGVEQIKEQCRDIGRVRFIEDAWSDIRYGIRMLLKNPSFTIVAVVTLALGIGANTALFSVVNAELIRELPYPEPGKLVYVSEYWPHEPVRTVPSPDFGNWQAQARLFDGLVGYGSGGSFNLTGSGIPRRVEGVMVTADFLTLLGFQPALGRNFQRDEDHFGATHVVLLSHGLWQRCFESSPSVIGKAVTLDGESYTIVGILPASFRLPDNAFQVDLLVPMVLPPNPNWHDRELRLLRVIARLKPNTTARELQAELSSIVSSRASEETPQFARMRKDMQVQVTSLRDHLSRDQRPFLLILLGIVAMVLMIACVNVANLQIARLVSRQREMALRLALGAGSVRLVRQLFTESLLLSAMGGVAGLAVGYWWGLCGLRRFMPTSFPQLETVRIDHVVLAFTLVISVLTGIVFGLGPVLAVFKTDLNESLKENNLRAVSVDRHHRLQGVLVSAQIAMAVVLLSGSGLLVRSFLRLTAVNPGFDPQGLLTARISLPSAKYPKPEAQSVFFSRLLELAQAVPGVQSAALAGGLPLVGSSGSVGTVVQGRPLPPPGAAPAIPYTQVSSNYFRALSIPLMRGRFFDEREGKTSPQVAIVNQAFVRLFFPDEDPVARHIKTGATTGPWREIVGVVGNVRQQGLADEESAEIYLPYLQNPCSELILVLKSGLPPAALADDTARIVHAVDPDQPLYEVATMAQRLSDSLSGPRFNMLLVGIFAVLALALATIGIYGVIVYFVSRRTHEIGIRIALGATPQTVMALVLLQTSWLIGVGVTIGLVAALAVTRVMTGLLYGVKPTDPLTFAIVSLLLIAIALLASYIPARRATKIDPMVALRYQ